VNDANLEETAVGEVAVVERFVKAINAHDLDAFVDCFDPHYQSEQPAYPNRAFGGNEQVRRNWSTFFTEVPDIQADLLRTAVDDGTVWAELRIHGTRRDGSAHDFRGVIIHGIRQDRIVWARLYLQEVEQQGEDIDEAVRRMAKIQED